MKYTLFLIFLVCTLSVQAKVTLHKIFSSNMVLQRNVDIPIFGFPNKNNQIGSTISNTFHFQYKDNSRLYFKVRAVDKYGNEGE